MNPAFASRDPARAAPWSAAPGRRGALVVQAHRLLFRHFRTFVGLLALPHAVGFVLVLVALRGSPRALVLPLLAAWGVVYLAAWTALIWAIWEAIGGRRVGILRALREVTPGVLGRLLLTHLLAVALLSLALGVLVAILAPLGALAGPVAALLGGAVGAVFVVGAWLLPVLFLPQVVILEGAGGLAALARGRAIVAGRRWRILGFWALFTLLEGLVSWGFSAWPPVQAFAQLVVAPIGAIWVTLLYAEGPRPSGAAPGPRRGEG